ncbi:MAG: hypothetical protein QF792_04540, partial [Phycisphaerae bacterium]|nr:hypothetical protein [Phycisphaerae bacterium]
FQPVGETSRKSRAGIVPAGVVDRQGEKRRNVGNFRILVGRMAPRAWGISSGRRPRPAADR